MSSATLSGAAKIGAANGALYLDNGALITLGALTEGAEIYVTPVNVEEAFTTTNEKAADYVTYFKTTALGRRIIAKDNALYITTASEEAVLMTEVDKVFDVGGSVTATCPVCQKETTWAPVTDFTVLDTQTYANVDHFYLANDIVGTGSGSIKTNETIATVCLHLNGKTVDQKNTNGNAIGALWNVANTTMNIMGEGTVIGAGYQVAENTRYLGGAIDSRGITNIYGGTYMSSSASGRPAVSTMNSGIINMYAGTITRNENLTVSNLMSGNVWLDTSGNTEFNMFGGTITGGSALKGGNVYMTRGEFSMYGGTIENGICTGADSNAAHGGGNVYMAGGTFLLDGGTITGGAADSVQGGNFRIDGGTFTMEDGVVSYGSAKNLGGNFRLGGSATEVTIKGGQILGGYVTASGGSIGLVGAKLTVSGGTIDGSGITQETNATTGGLVYINSGNMEVTGTALLKGGKASGNGNGIYVAAGRTLVVSGGTIESNVVLNATGKATLSGAAKISDINVASGAKLTLGALTEGADIFVTATAGNEITEANENVATYATYITSALDTLKFELTTTNTLKAVEVTAG